MTGSCSVSSSLSHDLGQSLPLSGTVSSLDQTSGFPTFNIFNGILVLHQNTLWPSNDEWHPLAAASFLHPKSPRGYCNLLCLSGWSDQGTPFYNFSPLAL